MDELKKRKTPRYQSFDYNSVGGYFITICTQNRRCILSRIVGTGVLDCPSETGVLDCPQIELTQYGEIADKYIKQLNDFYEHLSVENSIATYQNYLQLGISCARLGLCAVNAVIQFTLFFKKR